MFWAVHRRIYSRLFIVMWYNTSFINIPLITPRSNSNIYSIQFTRVYMTIFKIIGLPVKFNVLYEMDSRSLQFYLPT